MGRTDSTQMRIAIVGDTASGRPSLARTLRSAGYDNVSEASGYPELESLLSLMPVDLVLLEMHARDPERFSLPAGLRAHMIEPDLLPVCLLTPDHERQTRRRAFQLGVRDVVHDPVEEVELLMRVHNMLESRWIQHHLEQELELARLETLERLSRVAERHDSPTYEHAVRLGTLAAEIAAAMGLERGEVEMIRRAAPLHDIGKIAMHEELLTKPRDELSAQEEQQLRTHTVAGAEILAGSDSPLIATAAQIARSHHEYFDGNGYPDGLSGESIPLPARIVAVADTYDALVSERPGKAPWTGEEAVAEIVSLSGLRYDPQVVTALLALPRIR
jgi:putative two-component system response regulator